MTRWEKYAKEKGVMKTKNSKLIWDEEKKDWVPRWGYKSSTSLDDWCHEVPENAGTFSNLLLLTDRVKLFNLYSGRIAFYHTQHFNNLNII
jgi:regulator of ribosome biosynthesis